ncbi:MAG: heme exporter protein CcmD [Porticoccus sp.]|nr:heme exporter protein CcmD [Porticoccus sp.]MBQ0806572.1 heme exporter protein CcmD [Porticoccus sp.]
MFQFESLSDFIQMGGHGTYVWAAYLISLLVLIGLVVSPLLRRRKLVQEVIRQQRREAARQKNSDTAQTAP